MGEFFTKFLFVFSKGAIQKYVSVLQRYFVQYLGGFDVAVLKEVVQVCMLCTCNVLSHLQKYMNLVSSMR